MTTWTVTRTPSERRHVQPFDWWCVGIISGLVAVWQGGYYLARRGLPKIDQGLWTEV